MVTVVLAMNVVPNVGLGQMSPQNPSPMVDTTRPHPRLAEQRPAGTRTELTIGTLYLSPAFEPQRDARLLVHFHGAAWLVEQLVSARFPGLALVTVQLGSGSRAYAGPFEDVAAFETLVREAAEAATRASDQPVDWAGVHLSSFSAGYGAVRAVLRHPAQAATVASVTLADSLHAAYASPDEPASLGQARDLVAADLEAMVAFAGVAADGPRRMSVTHSEVYPGTYASTTETADYLLDALGVRRTAVLTPGPLGMQQLSSVERGGFWLAGYAGNSAPDHLDHLYALGDTLERTLGDPP